MPPWRCPLREVSKDGNFTRSRPYSPTPQFCMLVVLQTDLYTEFSDLSPGNHMMPAPGGGRLWRSLLLAGLAVLCTAGTSSANEREQQLADRLVATVEAGEPVWLESGGREFLALHHAALGALPRHAVLLVHGMGGHPDWPEVVAPLRTGLQGRGWSTLSLQMPLLAPSALADDYGRTVREAVRRIGNGVEFLRGQGYACVVLAGYSFGASQALAYLAGQGDADGLIIISILAREFLQPPVDLPSLLGQIKIPVLDIYGRRDFPEVVNRAHDRRIAARGKEAVIYEQRVIDGAGHYFTDREQQLVDVMVEWLDAAFGDRQCGAGDMAVNGDQVTDQNDEPRQGANED